MPYEKELSELVRRRSRVYEMGGAQKVQKHHDKGNLTARERVEKLLDRDSFLEIGAFNHSDMPGMHDKTPADSTVAGYGKVDGRRVIVLADDFTVLAATSSRVAIRKENELKLEANRSGFPLIYLAESGGARMPDIMGSRGLASFGGGGSDTQLHHMTRVRRSPMVTAILGECFGNPIWMASLSDFVVQTRGSSMAVSGPRILKLALGESVTNEELGGCRVHGEITGMSDCVAEKEEDCYQIIGRYLSYMPSNCDELPPDAEVSEGSGSDMDRILEYLPEKRNRSYDMNRILECIADKGSLFPIKEIFGITVITALARVAGKVIGIVANQPMFRVGAMDTDGIDKVISFLCLCDSFNIPVVFFHDTPGFLVGKEAERRRVGAKVINYMNAIAQMTVPKISIIVRKTYGMAFWNMGGSGCGTNFLVAWPTAEMSFVAPEIAANVVYGGKLSESERGPEHWNRLIQKMKDDASPYGAAGMHYIHDIIDPRQTRNYIAEAMEIFRESRTKGLGEHKLANWPTKF
jgi:acetyl-CoA carboxylase carboxyltransferase component